MTRPTLSTSVQAACAPSRLRAGFTAVELTLAVFVIGLVSYMVALGMDTILPGERLNTTVRSLAGVLQGTRSDAIARNAEFFIEYDLDNGQYRVLTPFRVGGGLTIGADDEPEQRMTLAWSPLEPGIEIASVTVAGEVIDSGSVFVRFDPLGAASDHIIVLRQPDFDNHYTIEVLALTGVIKFHKGVFFRDLPEDEDFR